MNTTTVAQRLRHEIRESGHTQDVVATILGISPQHLSAILNSQRRIDADMAQRLEAWCDIPAMEWLTLRNNELLAQPSRTRPTPAARIAVLERRVEELEAKIRKLLSNSGQA